MTAPVRPTPARAVAGGLLAGVIALLVAALPDTPVAAQPAPKPFADWPKNAKPDAVLLITGQTYGYLQPCGCSRPQLGGLERRANFVKGLKDKGWPVAGVDLGDIPPAEGMVAEQVQLKYATTLPALREMGYVAVGVGKSEIDNGLYGLLGKYAGKKEQPPYTLAGNLGGSLGGRVTPRADAFPGPGERAAVGLAEVADVGGVPVGIASVAGPSVQKAVAAMGARTLVGYTAEKAALEAAVKELEAHPKKPALNVLLYQGTLDEAKAVAKAWPQFRVIVCLSDGVPEEPVAVGDTRILRVGMKGQYVGVLGAFKTAAGGFELKYEAVPMGEGYVTAGTEDAARKANPALPLLDEYAASVKRLNLLGKVQTGSHPAQRAAQKMTPKRDLAFVGSDACVKCHAAEHEKWSASKHGHAFDVLEKVAKRPALREFDAECVACHTTGFGYQTGYRNQLSTPALKHVGCESCHGPGGGHAADEKDKGLIALQVPWRKDPKDRLPGAATMARLAPLPSLATPPLTERVKKLADAESAKLITAGQRSVIDKVEQTCVVCHDRDNDPNFDLFTYWPKVIHPSAPAKKGPAAGGGKGVGGR